MTDITLLINVISSQQVRNNTRINHVKLFPIPMEIKFVEAKRLIREENLQKLIMEREERIVQKAISRLEQSFISHRKTANLSLHNSEKNDKGNLAGKRGINQKYMSRLHDCNQILKNIKKIYESVHYDVHCNNDVKKANLLNKHIGSEKLQTDVIQKTPKIESQGALMSTQPKCLESKYTCVKLEERKLNTTPRENDPQGEEHIELQVNPGTTDQIFENYNEGDTNLTRNYECRPNLSYYWKVWRKFVLRVKSDKRRKIIMSNKIDIFLGRLTHAAVARQPRELNCEQSRRNGPKKRAPKPCQSDVELERIENELKNSATEAYECLQKNLKNFHANLQPKVKALSTLPQIHRQLTDVDKKIYPVPEFLVRMESRYKERKKRWEEIQRKKDEIQAEKEKIEKEREEERLRMEELKKREKLEEIIDRRRQRKEAEEKRQRERQLIRQQIKQAQEHYTNYLLRLGFNSWLRLFRKRCRQTKEAITFFDSKLLKNCLTYWRSCTFHQLQFKYNRADQFCNNILLKNALQALIIQYNESIMNYQAAVDWADAKLLEKAFQSWLDCVRQERVELVRKEEIASSFCER